MKEFHYAYYDRTLAAVKKGTCRVSTNPIDIVVSMVQLKNPALSRENILLMISDSELSDVLTPGGALGYLKEASLANDNTSALLWISEKCYEKQPQA